MGPFLQCDQLTGLVEPPFYTRHATWFFRFLNVAASLGDSCLHSISFLLLKKHFTVWVCLFSHLWYVIHSSLISEYYKTPRIFIYKSLYGYRMYSGVDFLNHMFGMFCLFKELENDVPKQLGVFIWGIGSESCSYYLFLSMFGFSFSLGHNKKSVVVPTWHYIA